MGSFPLKYRGFSLFLLISYFCSALGGVPVLLWESSKLSEKETPIPALDQLDGDDFSNHLAKKVHAHQLLVVVFVEPTLSVEDFSWKDDKRAGAFPLLENITGMAAKTEFIPSVDDPVGALKDLVRSQGYSYVKFDRTNSRNKPGSAVEVTLSDPLFNEDRPQLLRRHDSDMARIYSDLLASAPRILAVFTGRQNSWVEADLNRVRREVNGTVASTTANIVWSTSQLMISAKSIVLTVNNKTYDLGNTNDIKADERDKFNRIIATYIVPEKNGEKTKITLRIKFNYDKSTWSIGDSEVEVLTINYGPISPKTKISASLGSSFSSDEVVMENPANNTVLVFKNFQAEKFKKVGQVSFSVTTSSNQFFTGPIWMGLLVTWTLLIILAWGITMLMDIKTMDRFDDPKGKTINVNATE